MVVSEDIYIVMSLVIIRFGCFMISRYVCNGQWAVGIAYYLSCLLPSFEGRIVDKQIGNMHVKVSAA